MVKTQVQIPDHLYQEAKRIARDYEMSFAEVVRRGLEQVVAKYPAKATSGKPWTPPIISPGRGYKGLSNEELKMLAQEDDVDLASLGIGPLGKARE